MAKPESKCLKSFKLNYKTKAKQKVLLHISYVKAGSGSRSRVSGVWIRDKKMEGGGNVKKLLLLIFGTINRNIIICLKKKRKGCCVFETHVINIFFSKKKKKSFAGTSI